MSEDFDKAYLRELAYKWKNGNLTDDEQQYLDDWENSHLDDLLLLSDESGGPEVVKQRMLDHLLSGMAEVSVNRKSYRLWPRFRIKSGMTGLVAAAAVAAIVLGVYFFNYKVSPDVKSGDEMVKNDIAPGKNGATITLANGKVIELSDAKSGVVIGNGRIAYSSLRGGTHETSSGQAKQSPLHDEVASIPRNDVMQMTGQTQKGQTYQFTLPDGTKVWLNADSKLEFPSSFVNSKTRSVKLSGEGYFEVSKDKAHPFRVTTDKQEVEVLGTHFNINAYNDESSTKTTLLEGSVSVNDVILKPSQQSILTASNRIKVQDVDIDEAIAWKNGYFMFESEEIGPIMRKIARWYNLEIVYGSAIPTDKFWGTVSRFSNVSQVLKKLELTGKVHFKIEGRRITVNK